jgi:hypothetical protein
MRSRWLARVFLPALVLAGRDDARAQAVAIKQVKQLDTGMRMCPPDIPAFEVTVREGVRPILEIMVVLKPAPDSVSGESIPIRIDLLDANGVPVALADSLEAPAEADPPWLVQQDRKREQYRLLLPNRRPKTGEPLGSAFRVRVSLDTSKTGAETSPFRLYWVELGQRFCKSSS